MAKSDSPIAIILGISIIHISITFVQLLLLFRILEKLP